MLATLAVLAALTPAPQDPPRLAPLVRSVHEEIASEEAVRSALYRLKRTRDGRLPGLPTPRMVERLRYEGIDAADFVTERLRSPEGEYDPVQVAFLGIREAWGLRGRPPRINPRPDLKELEKAFENCYRTYWKALGSGNRLEDDAPRLHAAIDDIRGSVENLGSMSRDDRERLTERMSRFRFLEQGPLIDATEAVVRIAVLLDRPELIESLKRMRERDPRGTMPDVSGKVLIDEDIAEGRFVVGGFGPNTYDCSQFALIVDPGGDDTYRGPVGGAGEIRRLRVVVDLAGNDTYEGGADSLGSATFGIGVLVDTGGDDKYIGKERSGGFAIGGVGVLIDTEGKDTYQLGDQAFGVGLGGTGLFMDLDGDDDQRGGVQSFGVGLPGGIGLCIDSAGNDFRLVGRERKQLTEPPEGQTSAMEKEDVSVGFGVGIGVLPLMSGGLGVFFDRGGDDEYQSAGLAFGAGLRGGAGVFRDSAGNDKYSMLDGGLGLGYANGVGIFFDDAGDDEYAGRRLILGVASLDGFGWFCDKAGNDRYLASRPSFGHAQLGGVAAALDLGGSDQYQLAGRDVNWRFVVDQKSRGEAVGVALDLGEGEDVFPRNPSGTPIVSDLQIQSQGKGDTLQIRAIVDRKSL